MKNKSVKLQQTESTLKELIPEALATLSDERVNGLTITEVDCSRGKYDADVYIYSPFMDESEINEALKQLRVVSNKIEQHTLAVTGWYRSPKLHFKYDKKIEQVNRMEELFERIKSE
jgi:ribosome-binding factor A